MTSRRALARSGLRGAPRSTPAALVVVLVLAVLVVLAGTPAGASGTGDGEPPGPPQERPNVVLISADDMRADDLSVMPHTRELLGDLVLTDFVANHPLCCPARAELLTGQLAQNNGVHHNNGPLGGYQALRGKDNTIATWFDDAGYETSVAGKYINGWSPTTWGKPDGWDHFVAFRSVEYAAHGYLTWEDGRTDTPPLHSNDWVTQQSLQQLTTGVASNRPFFHWASYTAPHNSQFFDEEGRARWAKWPIPAERHADLFADERPPGAGSASYVNVAKQQWTRTHRMRLRSLQSVDEGVRDLVARLDELGVAERTVVVFTSDNGYLLGEHGLRGKNSFYEESLRVPLLATGPGVAEGRSAKGAMLTDLAPSLAALAGVTPEREVDGRADLFSLDGGWSHVPIQAGTNDHTRTWSWRGVRTPRWTYVEHDDGRSWLFNRVRDPDQQSDLADTRRAVARRLGGLTPPLT